MQAGEKLAPIHAVLIVQEHLKPSDNICSKYFSHAIVP